jgi:hypothetical protein
MLRPDIGLVVPHLRNPFSVEVVVWGQRLLSERGLNMVLYPTMLEDRGGATEYHLSQENRVVFPFQPFRKTTR